MLRFKLLAAIASCAVLFSAAATADDHGRGHSDGRHWNNRGDWHQSDGRWTGNRWNNYGYYGRWNSARYVPVARPVYVPRPYWGGYYYPAPPVYYGPPVAPVYPYYPYYGGYNQPSVTGSIIFTFPFHF